MGLDITAHRRMLPVIGHEFSEDCWNRGHVQPYPNPSFPEQAEGIIQQCYSGDSKTISFRAGSYSGYNWWRNELAQMAQERSAETVWNSPSGPFVELINFADNEGVIGPKTSAKLALDFAAFQSKANERAQDGTMFTAKYALWRAAFELAADDGFVRFH